MSAISSALKGFIKGVTTLERAVAKDQKTISKKVDQSIKLAAVITAGNAEVKQAQQVVSNLKQLLALSATVEAVEATETVTE